MDALRDKIILKGYGQLDQAPLEIMELIYVTINTFHETWREKKVLITGHNGFKGSWLCLFLMELELKFVYIYQKNDDPNTLFNKLKLKNNTPTREILDSEYDLGTIETIKSFSPDRFFT